MGPVPAQSRPTSSAACGSDPCRSSAWRNRAAREWLPKLGRPAPKHARRRRRAHPSGARPPAGCVDQAQECQLGSRLPARRGAPHRPRIEARLSGAVECALTNRKPLPGLPLRHAAGARGLAGGRVTRPKHAKAFSSLPWEISGEPIRDGIRELARTRGSWLGLSAARTALAAARGCGGVSVGGIDPEGWITRLRDRSVLFNRCG
jgi:hypothetical protein